MAVKSAASGYQLISPVGHLGMNARSPLSLVGRVSSSAWNSAGNPICLFGIYAPGTTAAQIGTRGGGAVDVWYWNGGVMVSGGTAFVPNSDYTLIGYSWDGAQSKLIINGNLIATSAVGPLAGTLDQVGVNGFPTGGISETSASFIDELAVFTRVVTPAEMALWVQQSVQKAGVLDGLRALYAFDEGPVGGPVTMCRDYAGSGDLSLDTTNVGGAGLTYSLSSGVSTERRVLC